MERRRCSRCARCGGPRSWPTGAYCRACHAAYQREHRPAYSELSEEARRRARCRSQTNVLISRGHIAREPCEVCGAKRAQARNVSGYTDPRAIRWVCMACFGQWRRQNR